MPTPSTSSSYSYPPFRSTSLYRRLLSSSALALNIYSSLAEGAPVPELWSRDDVRQVHSKANQRHHAQQYEKMNHRRNGYVYGQQPLVHTFETQQSCSRRCTLPCVMQNVEDLMMPRWVCPSQVRGKR